MSISDILNRPHLAHLIKSPKKSKYGNHKTKVDGYLFDSKAEATRYSELKMLERSGIISNLELQPKFLIIPQVKWNGKNICKKSYIADFLYVRDGVKIVEDKKGFKTKDYILKRQLFLIKYPEYKFIET